MDSAQQAAVAAAESPPLLAVSPSSPSRATLYIGNLSPLVTEAVLYQLFSTVAQVATVKLIRNKTTGSSSGYGFVDLVDRGSAEAVVNAFNGTALFDRAIKVGWAQQALTEDTSGHFHIFVGDLSPEVTDEMLRDAFANRCRNISDARVMWDHIAGKSRGYGFVAVRTREDAHAAVSIMNGEMLAGRPLRVNWATPKLSKKEKAQYEYQIAAAAAAGAVSGMLQGLSPSPSLDYGQPMQTMQPMQLDTMYLGNLPREITEDELRVYFVPFGAIQQVRLNTEKCFAFIKFESTDSASRAVAAYQGKLIGGRPVKVGWGRERRPQRATGMSYMLGMAPSPLLASQQPVLGYPYMYAAMSPTGAAPAAAAAAGEWYFPPAAAAAQYAPPRRR